MNYLIAILILLAVIILPSSYVGYKYYTLKEKEAWVKCIKNNDQADAQNLVCRSIYPEPYNQFYAVYVPTDGSGN